MGGKNDGLRSPVQTQSADGDRNHRATLAIQLCLPHSCAQNRRSLQVRRSTFYWSVRYRCEGMAVGVFCWWCPLVQTLNESILQPITYSVVPAFSGLADLMGKEAGDKPNRGWEDALGRAIDEIAGLTAVDGATLINADYELLAFGAKIIRRKGSPQVGHVIVTEPIDGWRPVIAEPAQFGGTRHLAGAQFVYDQRDAIALVASQDGRFTVFTYSPSEEVVDAHRIDVLLL
jgi:hypothetical protein